MITVYSTPVCPYCHKLKDWMKKEKIEFKDIDVSKDRKAAADMVQKSGQMGVPVTEINGKIVIGYDPETIQKLLKEK